MKNTLILFIVTILAFGTLVVEGANVYDIISSHPRLKTLTTALKTAKLDTVLSGQGPFTVFAPVDEAFTSGNMQSYKLKFLLDPANSQNLKTLLTYHVISGAAKTTSELTNDETLKTVEVSKTFFLHLVVALCHILRKPRLKITIDLLTYITRASTGSKPIRSKKRNLLDDPRHNLCRGRHIGQRFGR